MFGDNCRRAGFGGQAAEARGCINAVGICTKKAPTYNQDDFFTDDEYASNIQLIMLDFGQVLDALKRGLIVVWPSDGIGTGIAMLPTKAPHTLHFINTVIGSLKTVYGVVDAQ